MAANATGEVQTGPLQLPFDCPDKLAFQGSSIASDDGLLLHCELDDALGLTDLAADFTAELRTGRNVRHRLAGLLRHSAFSRPAGFMRDGNWRTSAVAPNINQIDPEPRLRKPPGGSILIVDGQFMV